MKKVLFFAPGLSSTGGIEHWMKNTINFLQDNDFECLTLSCFDFDNKIILPNLSENNFCLNERFEVSKIKKIIKIIKRVFELRKIVKGKEVNVIIASADSVIISALLFRLFNSKIKLIPVIHQELKRTDFTSRVLLKLFLRIPDKVVTVSKGIETELSPYCNIINLLTIYNAVDLNQNLSLSKIDFENTNDINYFNSNKQVFVAIGRLEDVKNFLELIKIWNIKFKNLYSLVIIGDGSNRKILEDLILSLSLQDSVFLIGERKNIFPYIAMSSALLSTSLYESFGMTLIESLSLGKPIISYDCDFGPREIFDTKKLEFDDYYKSKFGYLVKNGSIDSYIKAMSDFSSTQFTSVDALDRARAFDINKIGLAWKSLINSL